MCLWLDIKTFDTVCSIYVQSGHHNVTFFLAGLPDLITSSTEWPVSFAINPITENMAKPPRIRVAWLITGTNIASLNQYYRCNSYQNW